MNAVAHTWRIPSFRIEVAITRTIDSFNDTRFTIGISGDEGGANPINTTLSVTAFAGFNGATIQCEDANEIVMENQETTAAVFGEL